MKGIINITDLALLYFEEDGSTLYGEESEGRRVRARMNFQKLETKTPEALKEAKARYLSKVREALKDIKSVKTTT